MAKCCLVKAEEKINTETVYRVMWQDSEFKINEKKFKDEFDAKEFYYSVDKPNRKKELQMIKECKFYTLDCELL